MDQDLEELYKSMKNIFDTQPNKVRSQWILPYILMFGLKQIQ